MSQPITLVLTSAGLDALVNAQSGGTDPIMITQMGISDQAFVPAPTLEIVPGEFKRIGTVSGQSVSETVIHLTAQDRDSDTYDLKGFGLFLSDGTLFAIYSQPEPIIRKTSIGTFLFSVDVAFADTDAGAIEFGDATFLYPPASETVKGVAEIATQDEVDDGTDDERFVTPLKLAKIIAQLVGGFTSATEAAEGVIELATQAETNAGTDDRRAITPRKLATRLATILQAITAEQNARAFGDDGLQAAIDGEVSGRTAADGDLQNLINALRARTITGSGLVTGGGNLTANRTLQVLAASAAEARAESVSNKALTPQSLAGFGRLYGQNGYATLPGTGGLIIQYGQFSISTNSSRYVSWPIAFPEACYSAVCDGAVTNYNSQDNAVGFRIESISRLGATAYNATISHGASFIAIGR
ncbi:MAG: gp53-like domain-containing protein [Qipengyuania pacifica]